MTRFLPKTPPRNLSLYSFLVEVEKGVIHNKRQAGNHCTVYSALIDSKYCNLLNSEYYSKVIVSNLTSS